MSLPGGIADKLGGRYESRWTLRCALRVLAGVAEWIEIEPLGPTGVGIEFVFSERDVQERHQVKRGRTGVGHWTLSALNGEGVLGHFRRILEQGGRPRFVSAHDAHELHELSDRARASRDLSEFFARLGKDWEQEFGKLRAWWGWDEQTAFEALTRTDVSAVGDDELDEWNLSVVERCLHAQPAQALASLAQVLIDNMQQRLDERRLRELLIERYGLGPRRWADTTVGEQVRQATADYRAPLAAVRLRQPIPRPESQETAELLRAGETLGVLVAGAAGVGKSEVVDQVLDMLDTEGWTVLAMRADRLAETPRPDGLGEQLGLPGSPVAVLAAVAGARPSLLVVDQLDAMSLASGRLRGLWEPTWTMLQQARAHAGMRVLVACRQFDLDNDPRLRELTAEHGPLRSVAVGPLNPEQIEAALEAMGLPAGRLSAEQRQLVELPLHLKLLEPLARDGGELDFTTITGLFDAFWQQRRHTVEERDRRVRFNPTLKLLSDTMSARRTLSVPVGVLELQDLDRSADVLASEQLLVRDGRSFAFFHERFFDFTFARYHLAEGRRVLDLLRGDEQDLFRRGQVRQVLVQERDTDRSAYLADLRDLLDNDQVRFHIRQVVLALLRELRDPGSDELEVLRPLLEGDPTDPRAPLAWRAVATPAWFEALDASGAIAAWLSDEREHLVDNAVRLAGDAGPQHAGRAAALVREVCDWGARWQQRVGWLVRFTDLDADRATFELALELARRAPDGSIDQELWLDGHELPAKRPEWAGELLAVLLERAQRQAEAQGRPHPLEHGGWLEHDYTAQEYVQKLGEHGPCQLVDAALPWVLEVAERDVQAQGPASTIEDARVVDHVWGHRYPGERHDFSDLLLGALERALAMVAAEHPDAIESVIDRLAASEFDVAQLLLYRALAGNPERHAERAAELVLEDERRLRCGYVEDDYWVTRELLQAVSPALSDESFARLEKHLMEWTPAWERRAEARTYRGWAQQRLLGALDAGRLSAPARRRLQELGRKLGTEEPEPPQGVRTGSIVSPIGPDAARRMSDEQWLAAIEKHRLEWHQKRTSDFVGGPDELAAVFEQLSKEEPERFARLGLRIGADAPLAYLERLLLGLSQPDESVEPASDDAVFDLVRHVAALPQVPGARWIGRLVSTRADHDIPDDVLGIVATTAADPDPDQDLWATQAPGGGSWYGGKPWDHGMNTVRGSAAEAIGRLLYARPQRADQLLDVVRALVADPVAAVRTCAAEALGGLMRADRALALELAVELAATDDRAVAARPVTDLLAAYVATDWPSVQPIVVRLLNSEHQVARRSGAVLACLAALQHPEAADMLECCLIHVDPAVRESAARVLAANLTGARYTGMCAEGLRRLFDDESVDVRRAAVGAFWHMRRHELGAFSDLALALMASRAFADGRTQLIHALEESTAPEVATLTMDLAERMVESVAGLGDIRTAAAGDAKELTKLLIRVLGDVEEDPLLRGRALDALDRLVAAGAWGVVDAMDSAER
jgi:hypothetical protein